MFFSSESYGQNIHLKIEGKNDVETKTIDSLGYSTMHKDYQAINSEMDTLKKALFKIGYIENELKQISKTSDSLFNAKIHLNKKYKTLYVYYNKLQVERNLLNLVSDQVHDDYFLLPFNKIEDALSFINLKISENGFPFSKLKLSSIKIFNDHDLKADLIIDSREQKRTIDHIVLKGYEKFPKSYLKYYLKIKPSQSFDLNTIKRKMERLSDLSFASQIKPPEVLFSKDSTSLYMYVEKTQSNTFDGFLGFGTNDDTNKLEFDGYLNLNLTNNLNYGESFKLLYKSDENDQKTFKADLVLPYLFGSPIGVDLQLQIFKKDSSFITTNQSFKLHYQINSKHKIYYGIIKTESNNLLDQGNLNDLADYNTNYYSFAYQFINPQSRLTLFPVNSRVYLETNFGDRKLLLNTERQSQVILDAFKIFNFNAKNSMLLKTNVAALFSDSYLENELFRFGGINSIRGFEENSLFASLYGVLNTEYRYLLSPNIYVHSIIDAAYFENKILHQKEKLFGYGFGFGILTQSGLLRFNYANGKQQGQKFKFSNSKIHISLTASF